MNIKPTGWFVLAASFAVIQVDLKNAVAQEISTEPQLNRVIVRLPVSQPGNMQNLNEISVAQAAFSSVAEDIDAVYARPLTNLPLTVVEVGDEGLAELVRKGYSVVSDTIDKPMLDVSVPMIGAPEAWNLGFRGADQAIAILDTGIDVSHPNFAGRIVAQECFSTKSTASNSTSFCPPAGSPNLGADCPNVIAGCGHGTHVAGIAAGSDENFRGVAPEAQIISIQVFSKFEDKIGGPTPCGDANTSSPCALSFRSDQLEALAHVAKLAEQFNIASVNMSLGGGEHKQHCDNYGQNSETKDLIDTLRALNIATVIASGNDGFVNAIGSPACISSALSVGNLSKQDKVRPSSNSAAILSFLAPGHQIKSSINGGGFDLKSGTSMATPHVAGAIAVLKSAVVDATVDQISSALTSTGVLITDTRNDIAKPRIDVEAAVIALQELAGQKMEEITSAGAAGTSAETRIQRVYVTPSADADVEEVLKQLGREGVIMVQPQTNSRNFVLELDPNAMQRLQQMESSSDLINSINADQISKPY